MKKSNLVFLLVGISLICFGIVVTSNSNLIGALIGYILGFVNAHMLYRDTIRSLDSELEMILHKMRRSLVTRWGIITLAVAAVGRFKTDWLFALAIGIAIGSIVSLIVGLKEIQKGRKG